MAVYDRWHKSHPREGDQSCKCGTAKNPLYPAAEHGQGDRWQVRWRDEDGKQCSANRPKRGGKRDESDPEVYAEALDAKITAELNTGTYIDPSAGAVTLEQFAKEWRAGLTMGPATLTLTDKHLAHIYDVEPEPGRRVRRAPGRSVIGKRPMAQLAKRPSLIQQWIKSLEAKGLAPSYVKKITETLSAIFNAAIEDGVVLRNPVQSRAVKPPRVDKPRIVPWTREQTELAAAALGRHGAMVDLGVGAGLRAGEIFGIAQEDIEFLGGREVHVRRQVYLVGGEMVFGPPKGGKARDVPLSDALAMALAAHLREHPATEVTLPWKMPDGRPHTAHLLFVRRDGRPYHNGVFTWTWHRARRAAGAPETRANGMHVLRHTFASACLSAGVDIRTLAEYLGHSDPGFTLRTYAHLMPGSADRARKAIDAFLTAPAGESSARKVP